MFNAAVHGRGAPRHLSTDHDPLFEAHRWTANLRLLEINEIKTVPHVPLSHPFVERLIGTTRREFLDHVLFWNARDLERKLADFQAYYNAARSHASLEGHTPLGVADGQAVPGGGAQQRALGVPLPGPGSASSGGLTTNSRRTRCSAVGLARGPNAPGARTSTCGTRSTAGENVGSWATSPNPRPRSPARKQVMPTRMPATRFRTTDWVRRVMSRSKY